MFTELAFKNYRALKDASLPLGPLNLLVGPNGSGKTSVLESFRYAKEGYPSFSELHSVDAGEKTPVYYTSKFKLGGGAGEVTTQVSGREGGGRSGSTQSTDEYYRLINGVRHYAFDAAKMRQAVTITPYRELSETGDNLAGFLDYIRDNGSDEFDSLTEALHRSVPEYDDIGFDGVSEGKKSFKLRRTGTKHFVPARHLSEGTLYVVALLAMVYQPDLPTVLCFEEPDRGLHPRLYREVKDALYRLAYPQEYGETRPAVQIIATTHSPYFLNEFTDHPEQIVVCEKGTDHNVSFRNLGLDEKARDILGESLIGDAWVTGALGGMPATVS
jgi:predicted ATPase